MNLAVRGGCGRGDQCGCACACAQIPSVPSRPPASPSRRNRDNSAGSPSPPSSQAVFVGRSLIFRFSTSPPPQFHDVLRQLRSSSLLPPLFNFFYFFSGQFWRDPASSSRLISPASRSTVLGSRRFRRDFLSPIMRKTPPE